MDILCVGMNHETAPVSVREKLALTREGVARTLEWLRRHPGIREALVLSTCNRVELYLVTATGDTGASAGVRSLFAERFELDAETCERSLYQFAFHKAVAHLFEVTSGMDSMVVGEPQIAGQVKDAYRQAVRHKTVGTVLNRLLHRAFSVSKRVRTETELSARAVSVSYVAVELARKIFGELDERTAMLAGAGEMAELAAQHLHTNGIAKIIVTSRTFENARRVAQPFQGEAVPIEYLPRHLEDVDILLCSMAAPRYILTASQVRDVLRARKHRPIFIIDIAVPRNVDPRVDDLENVYLYDLDDLQKVLKTNLEQRRKELGKAQGIVQEEVRQYLHWLGTLDLVPTIVSLRERAEEVRQQEIRKAFSMLGDSLDPAQRRTVESMTQAIVNKILHAPIAELKRAEKEGDATRLVEAVQRLFSLAARKES